MAGQDTPAVKYTKSSPELLGRLIAFYEHCIDSINAHTPPIAVSYIVKVIDELAPHVERHNQARKALLWKARGYSVQGEEAADG